MWRQEEKFVSTGAYRIHEEGKTLSISQVEEFRASDKPGDCCQLPQLME